MKQISLQWVKSPRTLSILSRRNENLKQGAEARADAAQGSYERRWRSGMAQIDVDPSAPATCVHREAAAL